MNNKVLVTGGTGFVGIHTIIQLLQNGHTVNTTLRSLSRKSDIIYALKEAGIADSSKLHFFQADLMQDDGWDAAMEQCDYVLHIASPFVAEEPKHEDELIIPARDGSLRVLQAARNAEVKRVVLTSSFAAVGYSTPPQNHIYTETDWTNEQAPIGAYIKSKTIAEKAAWQFMNENGGDMELAVINPTGIFGNVIGGISSASVDTVIKGILNGVIKESPSFTMGVVDVRDVAAIHLKAMLHPDAAGQRFIATSKGAMSFYDVAELIKTERPEKAAKVPILNRTGAEYYVNISNEKAHTILDWQPRSMEEAILASVDSL